MNLTLSEQFKINDLMVVATLVDATPIGETTIEEKKRLTYRFEILRIFKGHNFMASGTQFTANLPADFTGRLAVGEEFLCWGIGPPTVAWAEPVPSDQRLEDYLLKIQDLPEKGAARLAFFQDYFEDPSPVMALDAYDEFAIASYDDLLELKDRMPRQKLLEHIRNREIDERNRRLYFTMLGVCGKPDEDVPLLESFIQSTDPADLNGLDSLVACYLCLKGGDGLDLIEKRFLLDPQVEFSKVHQIISSLRFHGTEVTIVDRQRLLVTMRKLLDQPRLADIVIPDLARWEDWSVLDQLVTMFKAGDPKRNWVRVPIFQYLLVCPLPVAQERINELKEIDPAAFAQASFLSNLDNEEEEDGDEDYEDDGEFDSKM